MSCLTQVTLSVLLFRHFAALAYGLRHKHGTRVVLDGHYHQQPKHAVYDGQGPGCQNRRDNATAENSPGCLETHGPNGRRRSHPTDSDGLYRLSDRAQRTMVQQSSWFGVYIETSCIITATSTKHLQTKKSPCGESQISKETRS